MKISTLAVSRAGKLVAWPTISICIYFSKLAHEISRSIAEAVDSYCEFVGHDKLNAYSANNGDWRELTAKKLRGDMSKLRDYPRDVLALIFEYNYAEAHLYPPRPGPYGVYIFVRDEFLESTPLATNFLRFDFDINFVEANGIDTLLKWYVDLLDRVPYHSSHAGLAYKRLMYSMDKASVGVDQKISRYYGLDPGFEPLRGKMRGRSGNPQWLNVFDHDLIQHLGGEKFLSSELRDSRIVALHNGLLIQGASFPPLGDINRGAPDIGSIPEIARLLKSIRTPLTAFRGPVRAQEWLARYDEMENRPWEVPSV